MNGSNSKFHKSNLLSLYLFSIVSESPHCVGPLKIEIKCCWFTFLFFKVTRSQVKYKYQCQKNQQNKSYVRHRPTFIFRRPWALNIFCKIENNSKQHHIGYVLVCLFLCSDHTIAPGPYLI